MASGEWTNTQAGKQISTRTYAHTEVLTLGGGVEKSDRNGFSMEHTKKEPHTTKSLFLALGNLKGLIGLGHRGLGFGP